MNPVPRWAIYSTFILSLVGLAVSIYLTIVHFEPQALSCSSNSLVNCEAVLNSAQSRIFGIPVAILGLAQYVVLSVINSPWGWNRPQRIVHVARFVMAVIGLGVILWLVIAEFLIIHKICLYCTGVHFITFAILIILTRVSPVQLGWSHTNLVDDAPLPENETAAP